MSAANPAVALRPWGEGDLWLLERLLGDAAMMAHLGGPESAEAIQARHARYLASDPEKGGLFAIVIGPPAEPVGWVGYWESEWGGESVWEFGWHVLPEHQGHGVASTATALALEHARSRGKHRHAHAFPAVDNEASNALCRALGFELLGEVDVEYPLGHTMHSNDWSLDLAAAEGTPVWPLVCPICGEPLLAGAGVLRCSAGHAFDVAREGYVNLLPSHHRARGIDGDVPSMLAARRRFLEAGHYRPLVDALAAQVEEALAQRRTRHAGVPAPTCVLEVGCGEGYYLGTIARAVREAGDAETVFVGADVSKAAARLAAKGHPEATFIVADINRRIYVAEGSVSVLLDVFAPRNPADFARVLEPGGVALIAIPAESHLASLREQLGLLGIQEDKEGRVIERFAGGFRLIGRTEVRYPLELTADAERDLVEMGPNHWHQPDEPAESAGAPASTEASFVILRLERTATPVEP